MSDNLRRYRAIRDALTQCYPGQPSVHIPHPVFWVSKHFLRSTFTLNGV
jgi:hypothetical protein